MSISGFLMYGAAQKNKPLRAVALIFLAVHLVLTSSLSTLPFLFVNLPIIFLLTLLLGHAKNQIVSSTAILIYSIIIDLICFFAFPTFVNGASLGAYIWAGIVFNFKSALPTIALAGVINLAQFLRAKFFAPQKSPLNVSTLCR